MLFERDTTLKIKAQRKTENKNYENILTIQKLNKGLRRRLSNKKTKT